MTYSTCTCKKHFVDDAARDRHILRDHPPTRATESADSDEGPLFINDVELTNEMYAQGVVYDVLRNAVDQGYINRIAAQDPWNDQFSITLCGRVTNQKYETHYCNRVLEHDDEHHFVPLKTASIDPDLPSYKMSEDAARIVIHAALVESEKSPTAANLT